MDRGKVIKGLEHCTSHDDGRDKFGGVGNCGGCPYYGHDCTDRMKKDALALLKEQDAVVPKYNARTNWYECGACHYSMTSGMHCRSELIPATKVRYCANCGFPVNWEGR